MNDKLVTKPCFSIVSPLPLAYGGVMIHEHGEMLSLTDMWRAAGSPSDRRPSEWLRSVDAQRFIDALNVVIDMGNTHIGLVRSQKGGHEQGTWAHWQIAMAYAKYLSANLHMWCNTVVRRHMEAMHSHIVDVPRASPIQFDMRVVERQAEEAAVRAVKETLPGLLRELRIEGPFATVIGVTAGDVLRMAGCTDRQGTRGLARRVSNRLRRFHAQRGMPVKVGSLGPSSAYVFDSFASREWLASGGKAIIDSWVRERRGDTQLRLI